MTMSPTYEYTTRDYTFVPGTYALDTKATWDDEPRGEWTRVWADFQLSGVHIVYRRPKKQRYRCVACGYESTRSEQCTFCQANVVPVSTELDHSSADRVEHNIRPPFNLAVTLPLGNEGCAVYVVSPTFTRMKCSARAEEEVLKRIARRVRLVPDER